ncbi:MAG: hypothetical protein IKG80_05045 [Clostridia bacterium]|nr:hypothetical protein [Clostridia bacterium]
MEKEVKKNSFYWKTIIMRVLKLVHFAGSVALFVTCWMMFYHMSSSTEVQIRFSILMCGFYAVVLAFLFRVFHAYTVGLCRKIELVYSLSLSELLAAAPSSARCFPKER